MIEMVIKVKPKVELALGDAKIITSKHDSIAADNDAFDK